MLHPGFVASALLLLKKMHGTLIRSSARTHESIVALCSFVLPVLAILP